MIIHARAKAVSDFACGLIEYEIGLVFFRYKFYRILDCSGPTRRFLRYYSSIFHCMVVIYCIWVVFGGNATIEILKNRDPWNSSSIVYNYGCRFLIFQQPYNNNKMLLLLLCYFSEKSKTILLCCCCCRCWYLLWLVTCVAIYI